MSAVRLSTVVNVALSPGIPLGDHWSDCVVAAPSAILQGVLPGSLLQCTGLPSPPSAALLLPASTAAACCRLSPPAAAQRPSSACPSVLASAAAAMPCAAGPPLAALPVTGLAAGCSVQAAVAADGR